MAPLPTLSTKGNTGRCVALLLGAHRPWVRVATWALVAAWVLACRPTLTWSARILATADARLNLVLLGVLLAFVAWDQWRTARLPNQPCEVAPLAALTTAVGLGLHVFGDHALRIHAIATVGCGVATYGLVGHYLSESAFRRRLPLALLAVLLLPMGGHLDTYLGFPLRWVTAGVVHQLLAPFAAGSVQQGTILLFENAAAHVDLPCSAIRSLWSGTVFFCTASVLFGARPSLRWLGQAGAFVALLLAANLVRVLVLSGLALMGAHSAVVASVHVPLGVVGFAGACAAALWMLRRSAISVAELSPRLATGLPAVPTRLAGTAALVLVALLPEPPGDLRTQALRPATFQAPDGLVLTPTEPTPVERGYLDGNGAWFIGKWRFFWRGGVTGSLLVVGASSWRAHHRPEQCLAGSGQSVTAIETHLIRPNLPIRVVHLARGDGHSGPRATYWFQSADSSTDDHAERVWDGLRANRPWVLVSLLFDGEVALTSDMVRDLHLQLAKSMRELVAPSP